MARKDAASAVAFAATDRARRGFVEEQTRLYQEYRELLDDARVDVFDARGALQPSALEEFCAFLFAPLMDPTVRTSQSGTTRFSKACTSPRGVSVPLRSCPHRCTRLATSTS